MSGTTIWLSHRKGWLTKAECVAQIERNTQKMRILIHTPNLK